MVRAHPRSRGENLASLSALIMVPGSSPLTRGKLDNRGALGGVSGLIPAHAGKTLVARDFGAPEVGSSPLTRGKQRRHVKALSVVGLIPAHAGKTSSTT